MKDEIKEILDKLQGTVLYGSLGLTERERIKLLDHITNLQEIKEALTNSLNKKVEEGIALQLRIDKAIEFNQIVLDSDYVYSQDEIAQKNLNILQGSDKE